MIRLSSQELESVTGGGIEWGVGLLKYVSPVGALVAVTGVAWSLACNYQSYCDGVSAGYDAAARG